MQTRRQFLASLTRLVTCAALAPAIGQARAGLLSRTIPGTNETLPVIGLGTGSAFDISPTDPVRMPMCRKVIQVFLQAGARVIDTAPGFGRAERITGELLGQAGARDQVFLVTRASAIGRMAGERQTQASLKALQTDLLDLVLVHDLLDARTQLRRLRALKEAGKVRYIGLSHHLDSSHDDLLEILQKEPVDFAQFNYSAGNRHAEQRLLPYCADQGIAVLIHRPYMQGNLLGALTSRPLPAVAQELQARTWAQLLPNFILAQPAVTALTPRTGTPLPLADNPLARQGPLPDAGQRTATHSQLA